MEEKKNGTGQRPAPKDDKDIIAKVHNACLSLFVIFVIMMILGQHFNNDRVISVGIGIGIATAIIQVVTLDLKEDE